VKALFNFTPVSTKTTAEGYTEIVGDGNSLMKVSIRVLELNTSLSSDNALFDELALLSSRRTVPCIFLNSKYLGGGDDVLAMGLDGTLITRLLLSGAVRADAVSEYVKDDVYTIPKPVEPAKPAKPALVDAVDAVDALNSGSALAPIDWSSVVDDITLLVSSESDVFTNSSNVSSYIYHKIQSVRGPSGCNWVGFYFLRKTVNKPSSDPILVLGPFQGKPACTRIKLSEGVCGAAATLNETQLVHDVHQFPGHIACDSASQSEVSAFLHVTTI
jgi:putative methionine-R-sulfoxide reductase with GAF domain